MYFCNKPSTPVVTSLKLHCTWHRTAVALSKPQSICGEHIYVRELVQSCPCVLVRAQKDSFVTVAETLLEESHHCATSNVAQIKKKEITIPNGVISRPRPMCVWYGYFCCVSIHKWQSLTSKLMPLNFARSPRPRRLCEWDCIRR